MFDIAWSEMLLLGIIAMIVVGPRDLPKVMRTVGGWVRKARGLAREFQGGIEEIAREAELTELRKDADALKSFDPNKAIKKTIDPDGDLDRDLGTMMGGGSGVGPGGAFGALGDPQKPKADTEPAKATEPPKPDNDEA